MEKQTDREMEEKNPLISIIIPVYNGKGYISACMEGLKRQTYPNLEIILVDDGSTDGSGEICDQYAGENVTILHKENGGAAAARNYALNCATGSYIAYVDIDDIITDDYIAYLYNLIQEYHADIAHCNQRLYYNTPQISQEEGTITVYSPQDALELMFYRKQFNNAPWGKLMKQEIARKHLFPEGKPYEDLATVYRWFDEANRIVYSSAIKYYYLQREGSVFHVPYNARKWFLIECSQTILDFISEHYPDIRKAAVNRFFVSNMQILREIPWTEEYRAEQKMLKENLKQTRGTVLRDRKAMKSTRFLALCCYLSPVVVKRIGNICYNFSKAIKKKLK